MYRFVHALSFIVQWTSHRLAAFFLVKKHLRATGIPGLADGGEVGSVADIAQRHMNVAAGKLELDASRIYCVESSIFVCDMESSPCQEHAFNLPSAKCWHERKS